MTFNVQKINPEGWNLCRKEEKMEIANSGDTQSPHFHPPLRDCEITVYPHGVGHFSIFKQA